MIPYYSKRNQVYPVLWKGRAAVSKHFAQAEDRKRELALYARLGGRLPLPHVLDTPEGALVLEHLPHPSLLEVLEAQEQTGFTPEPWLALCRWLCKCHELCGQLPDDGNLRNFLWNAEAGDAVGLDLEGYAPRSLAELGADLCASVLTYAPENTPVKEQVSACLAAQLGADSNAIFAARAALHRSRGRKQPAPLSGVILAGGRSSRMGRDKSSLVLGGRTLLELQAEKLRALGITDILLSGEGCRPLPGTRVIPDVYPHRGPLGGLHACLQAAEHPACLVLSVDVPLLPLSALAQLRRSHAQGVTVLRHGDKQEPLMGVYDRGLSKTIGQLLDDGVGAVRALAQHTQYRFYDYLGPEAFLQNCNTPEDFAAVERLAEDYRRSGIPLF